MNLNCSAIEQDSDLKIVPKPNCSNKFEQCQKMSKYKWAELESFQI